MHTKGLIYAIRLAARAEPISERLNVQQRKSDVFCSRPFQSNSKHTTTPWPVLTRREVPRSSPFSSTIRRPATIGSPSPTKNRPRAAWPAITTFASVHRSFSPAFIPSAWPVWTRYATPRERSTPVAPAITRVESTPSATISMPPKPWNAMACPSIAATARRATMPIGKLGNRTMFACWHDLSRYCESCADWLCIQCKNAHARVRLTKDHVVTQKSHVREKSHNEKLVCQVSFSFTAALPVSHTRVRFRSTKKNWLATSVKIVKY